MISGKDLFNYEKIYNIQWTLLNQKPGCINYLICYSNCFDALLVRFVSYDRTRVPYVFRFLTRKVDRF